MRSDAVQQWNAVWTSRVPKRNVQCNCSLVDCPHGAHKCIYTHPRQLAIDLSRQWLPGTFEHALNHLLDQSVDLSHFDARFKNDETGAPAYSFALLLTVVLFAYAQGIVSSRQIARACEKHVPFIALCGDRAPHFTTIA